MVTYLSGGRIQGITSGADTLGTSANATNISDPTSVASGDTNGIATPSGLGLKSLYFDGNDAMNIDGAEPFSTTVGSISLWWYNDGSTNDDMILVFGDTNASSYLGFETKTGGLKVAFRSSGGTQWEVRRATGGSNGGTMSVGWHNMIVSQNGTAVLVYVDGVSITNFDTSTDKSKWMESNLDNGRIGCDNISSGGNRFFFTGNIMEIAMWNVALTQTQVTSLWNSGNGRLATTEQTGLKVYYDGSSSPATNYAVVDEKAAITNVPAGTRYEETNTRKIYRRKAASSSVTGVATPTGLGDYCMDMTTNGTVYRTTGQLVNNGDHSVSLWYYPAVNGEEMSFYKHWSAGGNSVYASIFMIGGSGQDEVVLFTRGPTNSGQHYTKTVGSVLTLNKWNLLTATWDYSESTAEQGHIYINGAEPAQASGYPQDTGTTGQINEVSDWAIGASGQAGSPTGTVEDLRGYVCDMAFWNVELSLANHQSMWNSYNQSTNAGGALATTIEVNSIRAYYSGASAGGSTVVNEATGSATEGTALDITTNEGITAAGTIAVAASWTEKGTA